MTPTIKFDTKKFEAAIKRKVQYVRQAGPDVLNNAVKKVLIGSGGSQGLVQLTRRATKQRILDDMKKPVSGTIGGRTETRPRAFWLALKMIKKDGMRGNWALVIGDYMQHIITARLRSAGYIVAGWLFAGAKFGVKTRRDAQPWTGGTAAESTGTKATLGSFLAGIYNHARGANLISGPDLIQQAINGATADIEKYNQRKFQQAVDRK